ncbi:MAG: hypothetical protein ABIH22_00390 [Candidatus Margulisiibacteriota bacterium]
MTFRFISVSLILILACGPALSATDEARTHNFAQEVDVVFWQTLPFATLGGHFIDRQLSTYLCPASATHWPAILAVASVVSLGNAIIHAQRVTDKDKGGKKDGKENPGN